MMLWRIGFLILGAGFLGGLVNAVVSGELKMPYHDSEARVFHPGWLGTVLVGGVAATSSWGLYGPLAEFVIVGPGPAVLPSLRLAELFGAVVIGFSGGRWLTAEVDRLTASRERDALRRTTQHLVESLRKESSEKES
jgi:hypothetical protein